MCLSFVYSSFYPLLSTFFYPPSSSEYLCIFSSCIPRTRIFLTPVFLWALFLSLLLSLTISPSPPPPNSSSFSSTIPPPPRKKKSPFLQASLTKSPKFSPKHNLTPLTLRKLIAFRSLHKNCNLCFASVKSQNSKLKKKKRRKKIQKEKIEKKNGRNEERVTSAKSVKTSSRSRAMVPELSLKSCLAVPRPLDGLPINTRADKMAALPAGNEATKGR